MPKRHIRAGAIAALTLSAAASAQTAWTSFENREGHAIASDPTAGVLMFGGRSAGGGTLLSDTHSYFGTGWSRLEADGVAGRRAYHSMVAADNGVDTAIFILFGGLVEPNGGGVAVPSGQTFVYGGGWREVVGAAPSARTGHAMVTDTNRNVVLLFGGLGGAARNDVWEFDPIGETWTEVVPNMPGPVTDRPVARFNHCMAFHPHRNRAYAYGGSGGSGGGFNDDIWAFDPVSLTWANLSPGVRPAARGRAAMAFLPSIGSIALFGGEGYVIATSTRFFYDDTWLFTHPSGAPAFFTQVTPTTTPPGRFGHAIAPDQLGNVVMLGGTDHTGTIRRSTWLFDGSDWTEELVAPPDRTGAPLSYDPSSETHLTFGGRAVASGADLDDTWELDSSTWRRRFSAQAPGPRSDVGLVHDPVGNRTLLFGGRANGECGTPRADTWEWNGTDWVLLAPTASPPAAGGIQPVFDTRRNVVWMLVDDVMWRFDGTLWTLPLQPTKRAGSAASFDSARNRLVLYGGADGPNSFPGDTWEWDGGKWTQVLPASSPSPARIVSAMAFDPLRQNSPLFGGMGANGVPVAGMTLWDGTDWSIGGTGPLARMKSSMVFATGPGMNGTVMFGGRNVNSPSNPTLLDDTWLWNGTTWSQYSPTNSPSPRDGMAMAFDPTRSRVVLFGGSDQPGSLALDDTWEFDGANWMAKSPANHPPARADSHAAFDPITGQVLLAGGLNISSTYSDTWSWNGTDWAQQIAARPIARRSGIMVGTPTTVLYGFGSSGFSPTVPHDDLWAWNGTDWLPADRPPTRTNYGAAYDARRDRVVVFGGRESCGSGAYLNDTWEWDGGAWQRRITTNTPAARERARLAFDAARGRVVLYGGSNGTDRNDTWEYDGIDWRPRSSTEPPPASSDHGFSYNGTEARVIAFGPAGTWRYGTLTPAAAMSFGNGCTGSAGVPAIVPKPWAGPWLGDRFEASFDNAPLGAALAVWGFSDSNWMGVPLPFALAPFGAGPGCKLLVSSDLPQFVLPSAPSTPIAEYASFVLPSHPSFLGAVMFLQVGFLDAGMGGAPVTTAGLKLTFGSK